MRIPDFFIVGAPRCGTTALHTYLSQHPDIFMPKVKESLHFATDFLPKKDYFFPRQTYLKLFSGVKKEKVVGEGSVFYLYSKYAAQNIYFFNNKAKIIIMLRNPTELIESYHARLLYKGDEEIQDLAEAIRIESKRKIGKLLPKNIRFVEKLFYSEVVQFTAQLKRYFTIFSKENILVIIYDDFRRNPKEVFYKTINFLGLEPDSQRDFPIINSNKSIRSNYIHRFINNPPKLISQTAQNLFSFRSRRRVFEFIRNINTTHSPRPPSQIELRETLRQKFSTEVIQLSELLGRDLTYWNT